MALEVPLRYGRENDRGREDKTMYRHGRLSRSVEKIIRIVLKNCKEIEA